MGTGVIVNPKRSSVEGRGAEKPPSDGNLIAVVNVASANR
jgi:hypothetical protein